MKNSICTVILLIGLSLACRGKTTMASVTGSYETHYANDATNPSLALKNDGSFEMMGNYMDFMAPISGTWTLKDSIITLRIQYQPIHGYGDNQTMILSSSGDCSLKLETDSNAALPQKGDFFEKNNCIR